MALDRIDATPVPYQVSSPQVLQKDLKPAKDASDVAGGLQASSDLLKEFTTLGEDRFVSDELGSVQKSIGSLSQFVPQVADQEPALLYRGLIRYCKTPWDPIGTGYEGLVTYDGSAWSRLGLDYDSDITSLQAQITSNDGDITTLQSGKANTSHTHAYTDITGVTTDSLVGRDTAGTGAAELLTLGTNLSITSGVLNAEGGSKIVKGWTPSEGIPPASGYPTLDTRNARPVLDFDDSAIEKIFFVGVMPDNYVTGDDLEIELFYTMETANANEVLWEVGLENCMSLDLDTDSFATYEANTNTVPATNGHIGSAVLTLDSAGSHLDSIAAGDFFRLDVRRTATHANDDATGDAELHYVEMRLV